MLDRDRDAVVTLELPRLLPDGKVWIKDFSRAEGDKLEFAGLTLEQFDMFFAVAVVDADDDGQLDDTLITLSTDEGFSVTLIGVSNFDAALDASFT